MDAPDPRAAWPGSHHPLGATWSPVSTNFAVSAPRATAMEVCLFASPDGRGLETRFALAQRTLGIWHGAVPGLLPGQCYGFRADGPWDPGRGLVFNPAKLLLDPYARAVCGSVVPGDAVYGYRRSATGDPPPGAEPGPRDGTDSAPFVPRSVVVHDEFDWGDDEQLRPRTTWADTVIYELHVKGFTRAHPGVSERLRGTYAGLGTDAVTDYLRDLGVTTVELLPVHQSLPEQRLARAGLRNYWGYSSVGFFAPDHGYSSAGGRGQQVTEFKAMVKALHAAGLEVVLDVVYNHTAEGDRLGPTLSLRGLDDLGYYEHTDGVSYVDVTGCGNTLDASYPPALRLVLDSLRYWVTEMHVDGFRFDLAPALARTRHHVDLAASFLSAVGQDPVLRHVKLVAEPWDATSDGYLVGRFPPPWWEWNDRYRDAVRDFWRMRSAGVRELACRLSGSAETYADDGRSPYGPVNFVTAHDGFTLRDLVTYERKRNEANLEDNRDGTDDNRSWNCGVEGESDEADVVALRRRQAANLLATLCLSAGVPMITAGDERGRTQRGNNNAYAQDNEVSWLDWRPEEAWLDVYDVARAALRLRRDHPELRRRHSPSGHPTVKDSPTGLRWLHPAGREMTEADWHDDRLRTVGMGVTADREPGISFLLLLNADGDPAVVRLPADGWLSSGEVVLSTDRRHPVGGHLTAGRPVDLGPHCLVLLHRR